MQGPSLVAASGGHSSLWCAGLSMLRPLLLRSTGSRCTGSVIVAHGPSCSAARGILPDQDSNPCPLHRQADSQPLRHQGSPDILDLCFLSPYSVCYQIISALSSCYIKKYSPFFTIHGTSHRHVSSAHWNSLLMVSQFYFTSFIVHLPHDSHNYPLKHESCKDTLLFTIAPMAFCFIQNSVQRSDHDLQNSTRCSSLGANHISFLISFKHTKHALPPSPLPELCCSLYLESFFPDSPMDNSTT